MTAPKHLSKEDLDTIKHTIKKYGLILPYTEKLLSHVGFLEAEIERKSQILKEYVESTDKSLDKWEEENAVLENRLSQREAELFTQTKNINWLNEEYKKLQSQLSQKDEAAQAAHKVWNERLREKDALIEKMRDCLNVIASWGEGPRVNGSFDEPYSSKKARECLNEIFGNSGEGKGERGPMTHCIKCGGYQIAGPFYKKDQYGAKSLQYVCRQCKYSEFQPTLDDEERREITAKQLAAILIKERK